MTQKTMTIGIDVPAYMTVDVPNNVAETKEALAEYARSVINDWEEGDDRYIFEAEYEHAEHPRVVGAYEVRNGTQRVIEEDIDLDPPPPAFEVVRHVEKAVRSGLIVEAYLLASTAHLTPQERLTCASRGVMHPNIGISMCSAHGAMLHLSDTLPGLPGAERIVATSASANLAALRETAVDRALEGLSDGLKGVVKKALFYGLPYVCVDADGPVIEGLPTYDND